MAERRPLVLVAGKLKELPPSDTLPGGSGLNFFTDQTPAGGTYGTLAGSVNGSNAVFTVAEGGYLSGSLVVSLNGQIQTQGSGKDWQETTPASGTFTFAIAPVPGDVITVMYLSEVGTPVTYSVSTYTATTVNITATSGTHIILIDATAGNVTVNLPTGVGNTATYIIKKKDNSSNTVTVDVNAGELIDDATTAVLRVKDESITIVSDNTNLQLI